ncbi:MAG: cytochrome c, partial [Bryobacteraceae bacterium]|nr:cytochrome c [Bryobacteraceae bacterium]
MQLAAAIVLCAVGAMGLAAADPDFYSDVSPILQRRCRSCHQAGEIGPMSLVTYAEVRPWASAMRESVKLGKMPPWFVDSASGSKFANDPRLSESEIAILDAWVSKGAPEGKRLRTQQLRESPYQTQFSSDLSLSVPQPFKVAANSVIEYQYFVLRL